jgi:cell division protein ZapD
MTTILYEHPLNERIRNYLKLEQLFVQVHHGINADIKTNHQIFFNALFSIIDVLERNDIKGDLIKELEKLQQSLVIWSQAPDIDSSALDNHLHETVGLICQLKANHLCLNQLKEDKFLVGLKQRFAIQGGNSNFDLPQLQFWLHQPVEQLETQINHWLSLLTNIENSLALTLKFIRLRSEFKLMETESGFYQDSGEGLSLLRIKVSKSAQYFPTISGNKFRYSIRFMSPCDRSGRRYSNQATKFQLACC